MNFSLAPGFGHPAQQAVVCAEGLLVPVPVLDSFNTLWHLPIPNSDPDALTGKEDREGDTRKNCRATSKSEPMA